MPTRRRTAARQDADDVGAPADLEIEAFLRVVGANLAPVLLREGGEGEDLVCGVGQVAREMGATALLGCTGEDRSDGVLEALVCVGDADIARCMEGQLQHPRCLGIAYFAVRRDRGRGTGGSRAPR